MTIFWIQEVNKRHVLRHGRIFNGDFIAISLLILSVTEIWKLGQLLAKLMTLQTFFRSTWVSQSNFCFLFPFVSEAYLYETRQFYGHAKITVPKHQIKHKFTGFPFYFKNEIPWLFPEHIRNLSLSVPNHIQNYSVTYITFPDFLWPKQFCDFQVSRNPDTYDVVYT